MTPAQAKQRVTNAPTELVAVDKILVGIRRRVKVGQVDRLAKILEADGLMHPILIDERNLLIAGARRLAAVKVLGWAKIPAKRITGLDAEERRTLELDENIWRLPYESHETTAERSREIARLEERVREAEAEANQHDGISAHGGPKRGRPPKPGSQRAKAKASGVPKSTVDRVDLATALGDRFPQLTGEGWSQSARIDAGQALVQAHEAGHGKAAERLIDGAPPAEAVTMVTRLAALPASPQQKLVRMLESREPEQVANVREVLTKGRTVRPEILLKWGDLVTTAGRLVHASARRYPELFPKLMKLVGQMEEARHTIEEAYAKELDEWKQTITGEGAKAGGGQRAHG